MPRRVDHAERRRQITDASRHVVARGGLEAATFQAVAAEAGVSVRLVQYYFGHKHALLVATHRAVIDDAAGRFGAGGTPPDAPSAPAPDLPEASPRDVLTGVLTALLPLDDARRADAVVLAAFHAAALTNADVTPDELLGAPRALVDLVAAQVLRAADDGDQGGDQGRHRAHLDAELVLAAAAGLTQGLIAGHVSSATALAVVDRLLDRLLGAAASSSSPRRHRAC